MTLWDNETYRQYLFLIDTYETFSTNTFLGPETYDELDENIDSNASDCDSEFEDTCTTHSIDDDIFSTEIEVHNVIITVWWLWHI